MDYLLQDCGYVFFIDGPESCKRYIVLARPLDLLKMSWSFSMKLYESLRSQITHII